MNRFVQLHVLTSYPPSNLNRDDTGRPKTAVYGDALRLRISSQSLKRAWRTSEAFEDALGAHIGTRTRRLGRDVMARLLAGGIAEAEALIWARAIAKQFGKLEHDKIEEKKTAAKKVAAARKTKAAAGATSAAADDAGEAVEADASSEGAKKVDIAQLAHVSPQELEAVNTLVDLLIQRQTEPTDDELKLLTRPRTAVDIGMFGRMLADSQQFSVDASVQVAHAFTVHRAVVEGDYFTAVDDLQPRSETGAGHLNERSYGSGLFYLYICIDRQSLLSNLGGDAALMQSALRALVEAATKVSPTGMQNSFASRAFASHVLAERGDQQPRSLAQAFLLPIAATEEEGLLERATRALSLARSNFDRAYGPGSDAVEVLDVGAGQGSLKQLADFVVG